MNRSKVKNWRNRTKERIVESMGGKCNICGYNRCNWALALHHLNPSQKDFGFGAIRANCRSWETIVKELRKCILVCHNCHSEIHFGIIKVDENKIYFDESYSTYTPLKKATQTYCPVCNNPKPSYQTTCSKTCGGKYRFKVDWDKVDLYKEIQTKYVVKIAEELGCSDNAVHKRLKKLNLK